MRSLVIGLTGLSTFWVLGCSDTTPTPGDGARGTQPAVLVATRVESTDGLRQIYVQAYPEVPTGRLDLAQMVEFGSVDVAAFDGSVFVWERASATWTRWEVSDDFEWTEGESFSFASFGVSSAGYAVFASPTRAFQFDWPNYQILEWNPTTMEINQVIPVEGAERDGVSFYAGDGQVYGDHVIWSGVWENYETFSFVDSVVVMALDLSTGEVRLIEDDRCGSSYNMFVDDAGDLHVVGDSYSGFYRFYGPNAANVDPACALTMRQGTLEFDRDAYVDILGLTGAHALYAAFHRDDRAIVAPLWLGESSPAEAAPTPDDYWGLEQWTFTAIDLETGTFAPIDGIPVGGVSNVAEYRLDGRLHVQLYDFLGEAQEATLYRIEGTTATPVFTTAGDIWAFERLR